DAVTAASADLSVTKSDGVTGVSPDTDTTYTITVANNNGPSEIAAVTVSDLIPTNLQNATWGVVSATGGATSTASGVSHSGNINDSVNLPKGGVVTYTLTAHVNPLATPGGHITNTVSLALPAGANDPTLGN